VGIKLRQVEASQGNISMKNKVGGFRQLSEPLSVRPFHHLPRWPVCS